MAVGGATRVLGVVGAPVAHSLSPTIFNAWLARAGIDAVYVALPVEPERFERFVEGVRGGALSALNITAPFKARALELADEASTQARKAGSANLLLFDPEGRIRALSTDGEGLLAACAEQAGPIGTASGPATILGAGGAARAAAAALLEAGVAEVRIVNRRAAPARKLAEALGHRVSAFDPGHLPQALDGAGVLINATPSLEIAIPWPKLAPNAIVLDMVYRPPLTPMLAAAAAAGRRPVDGLAMLIGQARPGFAAIFGRPPPPSVDVRALALAAAGA